MMEILAYTATETLLWDYSESEGYYVLAKPPAIAVKTLFLVPMEYAYQWYYLNVNLTIVYNPFTQINLRNLHDACDCPVTITASISVAPISVPEDGSVSMIYTVTLDTVSDFDTTVNFTLTGTATEGVDYDTVSPHFVTITAGLTSASFGVHPINDGITEGDETVIATLSAGSSGTNVVVISHTDGAVTGTIIDAVLPTVAVWQGPLSVAPAIAKAQSGFSSVPLMQLASYVTWDPATAVEVILSNGNLTATRDAGTGTPGAAVQVGFGKTSGKYYFEVDWATMGGFVNGGSMGVFTTTASYFDLVSGAADCTMIDQGTFFDAGPIFAGGAHSAYRLGGVGFLGPFLASGYIIGMAVDLDNRKMWFRVVTPSFLGNLWNGDASADPSTNVNGVVVPAGTIIPAVSYGLNFDVYIGNFGATAFSGTVPTGFTAGWPK